MGVKKARDIQKEFNEWGEKISSRRLPRFEDLPAIDLYMDQIIALLEEYLKNFEGDQNKENKLITSSMINNYVKQKIIPPPIKKKYNKTHLSYLIIICLMKPITSISVINEMIEEQLLEHGIDEVLDMFCIKYENSFKRIFELAKKDMEGNKETSENQYILMGNMAISMAISSSISKLIADNTIVIKKKDNISIDDPKKKKEVK